MNSGTIFTIEIIVIICVAFYQIYLFLNVLGDIFNLKEIFDDRIRVRNGLIEKSKLALKENIVKQIRFEDNNPEDFDIIDLKKKNVIRISITEASGSNEIVKRITGAINNYLINNFGATVNFSIIKDIIDREIDVADEEISQAIPTPLYLGLAATMIGIIFGLYSFLKSSGINAFEIAPLIRGVSFAMGASLLGLSLTTSLSSVFYKKAKKKVLREKNEQLNYLLAELLPELIKSEDSGVSGLKLSLDRFSRDATTIVDDVNTATRLTGDNLKTQLLTIEKIDKMDMSKVSKTNLELFSRLERNMEAFNKFSEFLSIMEEISINLQSFALRTVDIDNIANAIHANITDSSNLMRFLTEHFNKIEEAGSAALLTVDLADSHFRSAIEKLKEEVDKRVLNLNTTADNHQSQLHEIYKEIGNGLNNITSTHLSEFKEAYSKSIPQFKQLDQLEHLLPIKETLATKTDLLVRNNSSSNGLIIDILKDLRININKISEQNSSIEKLSQAVSELTKKMQNKEHLSGGEPIKNRWLKISQSIIKSAASVMILIVGGVIIYIIFFS